MVETAKHRLKFPPAMPPFPLEVNIWRLIIYLCIVYSNTRCIAVVYISFVTTERLCRSSRVDKTLHLHVAKHWLQNSKFR